MTSYDDIWSCFLDNSGKDLETLPNNDDEIHKIIHNAIRRYNAMMDSENKLNFDDSTESIDKSLDDNKLLLLSLYVKLIVYTNDKEYFEQVYQYDIYEVKSKFYKQQDDARQATIDNIKKEIKQYRTNMRDFLY